MQHQFYGSFFYQLSLRIALHPWDPPSIIVDKVSSLCHSRSFIQQTWILLPKCENTDSPFIFSEANQSSGCVPGHRTAQLSSEEWIRAAFADISLLFSSIAELLFMIAGAGIVSIAMHTSDCTQLTDFHFQADSKTWLDSVGHRSTNQWLDYYIHLDSRRKRLITLLSDLCLLLLFWVIQPLGSKKPTFFPLKRELDMIQSHCCHPAISEIPSWNALGGPWWFACSPWVCVDSLWVLWLPPIVQKHAFGGLEGG